MDTATKTRIDAAKIRRKATGDLIGNKIADEITSIGKPNEKEKNKRNRRNYIPPEKRQQIINDLRLF